MHFPGTPLYARLVEELVPALSALDNKNETTIFAHIIAEFVGGTFEEEFCGDLVFSDDLKLSSQGSDNCICGDMERSSKFKLLEDATVVARETSNSTIATLSHGKLEFDAVGTYLVKKITLGRDERKYDLEMRITVNGHGNNILPYKLINVTVHCDLKHDLKTGAKSLWLDRSLLYPAFKDCAFFSLGPYRGKMEQVPWNLHKWKKKDYDCEGHYCYESEHDCDYVNDDKYYIDFPEEQFNFWQ